MPYDTFKPSGPVKSLKPEAGGGNNKNVPLIGVVKDNIDPTCSGRIKVALQSGKGGADPDSSESWVTVQYLSTFFGAVGGNGGTGSEDYGSYKANPSSYGQWQAPPDIGTKVVCIFINGDANYGFYIGCIPESEKLHMVPAIGAAESVTLNDGEAASYAGATRLPASNINVNNKDKADSNQYLNTARPVHSYTASIMSQQGIIRDPVRGPISTSASREPASRVGWGVSSPGRPIYSGGYDDSNLPEHLEQSKAEQLQVVARRGGHSIVMDDGDIIGRDQLIRIRTSLGHQILMSDDGQTLMILHSNGQSYVELGKEGTVDIYSTNSFNVRTQGDINFHADQNINIHASENLNIQAKNIKTNSDESTQQRAGSTYQINTLGNYSVKSAASAAIAAAGEGSLTASGPAFIVGSKINLNTGSPGTQAQDVSIIPLVAQTDTLFDDTKGWIAAPGKLITITSRTPAHAPWINAGQGISIKTSGSATDNLPSQPSTDVQATNQLSQSTGVSPPATATVASSPVVKPVSSSIDAGATSAVLGATATAAASGVTSSAVVSGAAIVKTNANPLSGENNATIAVGSFGQTASQLVAAGVLKPGSDRLINAMASSNMPLTSIAQKSLFTGIQGVDSIEALASNTQAQADIMVNTLQRAQTSLTTAGVITGKETATQTAGLVTAAATVGPTSTINAIKQSVSLVTGNNTSHVGATVAVSAVINQFQDTKIGTTNVSGSNSMVMGAIGAGAAAAGLSSSFGGLGGISNAVNSLFGQGMSSLSSLSGSVNGIPAVAFDTIKNSFPALKANIPQNLSQLAKDSAAKTEAKASSLTNSRNPTTGIINTVNASGVSNLLDNTSIENTIAGIAGKAGTVNNIVGNTNNIVASLVGPTRTGATTPTLSTININNMIDNLDGVTTKTLSGISGSSSELLNLIGTTTGSARLINTAVDQVSGLSGASQALKSGGLTELINVAKNVQTGGGAARASALASGINNLPGGIKAISSVTDQVLSSAHVPGTSFIGNTLKNNQTLGSLVNSLSPSATTLGGLSSALSSVLSSGEASSLMTSVSAAIGNTNPSPVTIPEIGINTFARDGMTTQIRNTLADPGIPSPNLVGDIQQDTIDALAKKQQSVKQEQDKRSTKIDIAKKEAQVNTQLYKTLSATLPAGDPAILSARKTYLASVAKLDELLADDFASSSGQTG